MPAPQSNPSAPRRRLLTRQQVISALREERQQSGLVVTAEKYGIKPSQLADIIALPPRARLSRRVWESANYVMYELFEKKAEQAAAGTDQTGQLEKREAK